MSLSSHLATTLDATLDRHGEAWLDKALIQADAKAAERLEALTAETTALRATGQPVPLALDAERAAMLLSLETALPAIEKRKGALYRWGRGKAAAVLIQLSDGDASKARLLAMATGQTVVEYLATSDASTARTSQVTMQREKDADEVISLLREIGVGALKAALPLLLSAM